MVFMMLVPAIGVVLSAVWCFTAYRQLICWWRRVCSLLGVIVHCLGVLEMKISGMGRLVGLSAGVDRQDGLAAAATALMPFEGPC